MGNDTPHIIRGGESDLKRILYSKYENAMVRSISLPGGMGKIPSGAIIAKLTSECTNYGLYVPYVPEAPESGLSTIRGGAFLVQDGAANAYAYVTMDDSYKFTVGDHLAGADSDTNGGSAIDLAAITAIDRTTYSHMAKITVTNQLTSALTIANGAVIYPQSYATAPFMKAVGVLAGGVDTGVGENAKGAQGALILKSAMLYKDSLENYDSEVLTDLGGVEDGGLLII